MGQLTERFHIFACAVCISIVAIVFTPCHAEQLQPCDISAQYGECELSPKTPADRLVYLIQDAHCQPEAQYNIANILEQILAAHDNVVIAIEGATGTIHADRFRDFPDKQALNDVSRHFVENGTISGTEYLYLTRDKPFVFLGAETAQAYIDNYDAMIATRRDTSARSAIQTLIETTQQIARNTLTARQQEFISKWTQYYAHELSFDAYVPYLTNILSDNKIAATQFTALSVFMELLRREQEINFINVENQRLALLDRVVSAGDQKVTGDILTLDLHHKLYKISERDYFTRLAAVCATYDTAGTAFADLIQYADYLAFAETFDKSALESDIQRAISLTVPFVLTTPRASDLFEFTRYCYLYRDLLRLQINETYLAAIDGSRDIGWLRETAVTLGCPADSVDWDTLAATFDKARSFYQITAQRDRHMTANLLTAMDSSQSQVGVLVAGGFHKTGIQRELATLDIGVCTVTPVIRKLAPPTTYFSLMENRKTPFERYVGSSTLALASWIADTPLVNRDIKTVRTRVFSSMLTGVSIRNLAPRDLAQIAGSLNDLLREARNMLSQWHDTYCPYVTVTSLDTIGNKLVVNITIDENPVVFVFSDSPLGEPLHGSTDNVVSLADARIGDRRIEVITREMLRRLQDIAAAQRSIDKAVAENSPLPELFNSIDLPAASSTPAESFGSVIARFAAYANKRFPLSVGELYDGIRYLAANTGDTQSADDLAAQTGLPEPSISSLPQTLHPTDLFNVGLELLKSAKFGNTVMPVNDISSPWKLVFQARGIQYISIDVDMPFEALVALLFDMAYRQNMEPGVYALGYSGANRIQSRVIQLPDNSLFVRLVTAHALEGNISIATSPVLNAPANRINTIKNGVLVLEKDGSFAVATCIINDQQGNLAPTDLSASIYDMPLGNKGTQRMKSLVDMMKHQALDHGILIRGILFRDQGQAFRLYDSSDLFAESYEEAQTHRYLPLEQGNWADDAGSMSFDDFSGLQHAHHIRVSDLVGGYDTFSVIGNYMDIAGKDYLDVGCQLGYNVFYAHLAGARFAAGIDINPYQQRASREVSAYLNENADISGIVQTENLLHPLRDLIMTPEGTTYGQLYFRTMFIKQLELQTGRKISQTPPSNIDFAIADARNIPYEDNSFDAVTSINMLYFIYHASEAMKEMIRVTRPGGIIHFIYSTTGDNIEIIDEAITILQTDHHQTATYEILRDGVIRIISKKDISSVDATVKRLHNHVLKKSPADNMFEEKPYLESIRELGDIPVLSGTVAKGPIDDIHALHGVALREQTVLATTLELIRYTYGSDWLDSLDTISIEFGTDTLVAQSGTTLQINRSALLQPMVLFMELERTLLRSVLERDLDTLQIRTGISGGLLDMCMEFTPRILAMEHIADYCSDSDFTEAVEFLKTSTIENIPYEQLKAVTGKLIKHIRQDDPDLNTTVLSTIREFQSLPHVNALFTKTPGLAGSVSSETLSPEIRSALIASARYLSDTIARSRRSQVRTIPYTIIDAAEGVSLSDRSIAAWMEFQQYYDRFIRSGGRIPDTLAGLFHGLMFEKIVQDTPDIGFFILTDLLKSLIDDPADPPVAPYLAELTDLVVMEIIDNLTAITSRRTPQLLRAVQLRIPTLQTLPASQWIGPRLNDALAMLNGNRPLNMFSMHLQSNDEQEFRDHLDTLAMQNNITSGDVVVLKINKLRPVNGGEKLIVVIVADTLANLQNSARAIAINHVFEQHPFAYSKEFNSATHTIGSGTFSLMPDLQSIGGLGSEFIRNETVLLQALGFSQTKIHDISHELRILQLYNRELNADLLFEQTIDKMGDEEIGYVRLAHAFYRIGILDSDSYNDLLDNRNQIPYIRQVLVSAVNRGKLRGESSMDLIIRKADQWVGQKAKLDALTTAYERLRNEQYRIAMPDMETDFHYLARHATFSPEDRIYMSDKQIIEEEQRLFDNLDTYTATMHRYAQNDPTGTVRGILNEMITAASDTSGAFDDIASYLAAYMPMWDIAATVPDTVRQDNLPVLLNSVFSLAELTTKLEDEYDANEIADILRSPEPITSLMKSYHDIVQYRAFRQFLSTIDALAESVPSVSPQLDLLLKTSHSILNSAGIPIAGLTDSIKTLAVNMQAHPRSTLRLIGYLASMLLVDFQEAATTLKAINDLDDRARDFMLSALSSQEFIQYSALVPQILPLIQTRFLDIFDEISKSGSVFGLLNPPDSNNISITPDPRDPREFIIDALQQSDDISESRTYGEMIFVLNEFFINNNIQPEVYDNVTTGIPGNRFALRIGSLMVTASPQGPVIFPFTELNPTAYPITKARLLNETFIPISPGTPLLWRRMDEQTEFYYTGGITATSVNDAGRHLTFWDIAITSHLKDTFSGVSERTYGVRIPTYRLYDVYGKIRQTAVSKTIKTISQFKDLYFSAVDGTPIPVYKKEQKQLLNDILHRMITSFDPVVLLREKRNDLITILRTLDPEQVLDAAQSIPYDNLTPEQQMVLVDVQDDYYASTGLYIDRTAQDDLNRAQPAMPVLIINDVPVGWQTDDGQTIIFSDTQNTADMLAIHTEPDRHESFSPFIRSNRSDLPEIPICSITIDETGNFNIARNEDIPDNTVELDMYVKNIQAALLNANITLHDLTKEQITIEIVNGHPRLGQRITSSPDGAVTVILDIDVFRSFALLQLVVRHEFDQHEGIAGEIKALINDVYHFNRLNPQDSQEILTTLRLKQIDLGAFADILEHSSQEPVRSTMDKIISLVRDTRIYPKCHTATIGMTAGDVAANAAHDLDSGLADRILALGYDPVETLIALTHPGKKALAAALETYQKIADLPQAANLSAQLFVDALLGDRHGAHEMALFFLKNPEIISKLEFTILFNVFAYEAVVELIQLSPQYPGRQEAVQAMLPTIALHAGHVLEVYRDAESKEICVMFEDGCDNVLQLFSPEGKLIDEKRYQCDNFALIAPQLISDQCTVCESMYGVLLDEIILLSQQMLDQAQTDEDLARMMNETMPKIDEMATFYRNIDLIDMSSIPVSKRAFVKQFLSDLVGSPLIAAGGLMKFAAKKDIQKAKTFIGEALSGYRTVRENMVRFRMIEQYFIAISGNAPMLIFDKTLELEANRAFAETSFTAADKLRQQLLDRVSDTTHNDLFVMYLTPVNPGATLEWIASAMHGKPAGQRPQIVLVSPMITSDDMETLVAESGIVPDDLFIFGSDILTVLTEDTGQTDFDQLIGLIRKNIPRKYESLIFLSGDLAIYSRLVQQGITAVPLPGIQTPQQPAPVKLNNQELFDRAA